MSFTGSTVSGSSSSLKSLSSLGISPTDPPALQQAIAAAVQPQPGQAIPVTAFTSGLATVTHLSWGGAQGDVGTVAQDLKYLGIDHVRASPEDPMSTLQQLADSGIKFTFDIFGPGEDGATVLSKNMSTVDALEKQYPGSVFGIGGPNEENGPDYKETWNGQPLTDPNAARAAQQALWNAVQADPTLNALPAAEKPFVLTASVAEIGDFQGYLKGIGDQSSMASAVSWHTYGGNGAGNPYNSFSTDKGYAAAERNIFVQTGEFGWNTDGSDQQTQATFDLTGLLDAFSLGDVQTAIYELQAQGDGDGGYGLFDGTTPKAAATAIHNLTTILSDPSPKASTFASDSLPYKITGLSANMHSELFEKSDGTFDLAVWDEGDSGNVTVSFGSPQSNVAVYDPLQGASPTQSASNASGASLTLSGSDVQIVQIGGNAAPGPGTLPTPAPVNPAVATPTPGCVANFEDMQDRRHELGSAYLARARSA
jgi:hypothetical protein